jgi:hypothetical protein
MRFVAIKTADQQNVPLLLCGLLFSPMFDGPETLVSERARLASASDSQRLRIVLCQIESTFDRPY